MENMQDLKGKNILVTGGGGVGVGAGVCTALSQAGARVIINELSLEVAEKATEKYPGSIAIAADISKSEDIVKMFNVLEERVGTVHGLVNNAGIGLTKFAHTVTEAEFDKLYSVDIRGVWLMSKEFVNRLLAKGKSGNIVNISSLLARSVMHYYGIYSSAKNAVEGLTRGMAVELGRLNFRVNAVGPGYVHAEQNYDLLKTLSDDPHEWVREFKDNQQALPTDVLPEDCGNVVAFLLSDLSRSVTGQTIYVDGGATSLLFKSTSTIL